MERCKNTLAEEIAHVLGLGVLEVGERFKKDGYSLKGTHEWRDRVSAAFLKEGIEITVIFDATKNQALIVEGRSRI